MEYEDIYEIFNRIEDARILLSEGDIELAEKVLKNLLNDLRRVIYPNDPFELLDELKMNKMVDELRYWGDRILEMLSYPEDDPVYSAITYAMKHPDEIGIDSTELSILANAELEGDQEQMVEEFYELLHQIAEENEEKEKVIK